jgi:hypothetical protein
MITTYKPILYIEGDGGESSAEIDLEMETIFYLPLHGEFVSKNFIKITYINVYLSI